MYCTLNYLSAPFAIISIVGAILPRPRQKRRLDSRGRSAQNFVATKVTGSERKCNLEWTTSIVPRGVKSSNDFITGLQAVVPGECNTADGCDLIGSYSLNVKSATVKCRHYLRKHAFEPNYSHFGLVATLHAQSVTTISWFHSGDIRLHAGRHVFRWKASPLC